MSVSADVSSLLSKASSDYASMSASVQDGALVSQGTVDLPKAEDSMGKDDFLTLLVTQMRYQDPLSPMDNTEFVAQLAQFRQLEGTNNMQDSIKDLDESFKGTVDAQKDSAAAMANTSAVSMIGKTVRLSESDVYYPGIGSDPVAVRVNLGNVARATVEIRDADGTVIKTMETEGKLADSSSVVYWDGSSDSGAMVKAGTYDIHIAGSETNNDLYAFVQDTVMGVRFDGDKALLKIGGKELPISDIMDVSVGSSADAYAGMSQESALALLGKHVHLFVNSVEAPAEGEDVSFQANIGDNDRAVIEVVNQWGKVVADLDAKADADGRATVVWDGMGLDGQTRVPEGTYTMQFADAESNQHSYAYVEGTVEGISTASGVALVKIDGLYYPLSQIVEIDNVLAQDGTNGQEEPA